MINTYWQRKAATSEFYTVVSTCAGRANLISDNGTARSCKESDVEKLYTPAERPFLITFTDASAVSSISDGGPYDQQHSFVNFTVRQCTVVAHSPDDAREIVEGYNNAPSYGVHDMGGVPLFLLDVIKVEKI